MMVHRCTCVMVRVTTSPPLSLRFSVIPDISELVELQVDLGGIPRERLEATRDSDGYFQIFFEVRMTIHSAAITFAMVYDGMVYEIEQSYL
jgi:hypothetical protein